MASHCGFCDTRRPPGGTFMMILNEDFIECCPECAHSATMTNMETGEVKTIHDVFVLLFDKEPVYT